jgi:hypothetical protein
MLDKVPEDQIFSTSQRDGLTASINDNIIMGDDSYDAFLNILEGDRNRSVTVDSLPAVERGEVLNPAGGFVSHGLLSSLNCYGGKCAGTDDLPPPDEDGCGAVLNQGGSVPRRSLVTLHETERSLSKDTFSFIIISKLLSAPFLIAILVFSIQIAIFSFLLVNVTDLSNSKNPFNFPPNVESSVAAVELLAIIIAIIIQDDVKKVILILQDGYNADVFQETFGPNATKFKWALSLVLRATEGLFGLFVAFMLIMQSTTVLDLLLNFTAMEFVSLFDDVVFVMLHEGYFGIFMMKEAKRCEAEYNVSRISLLKPSCLSAVYFVTIFAFMFGSWFKIMENQKQGDYLCRRMYIQVDKAPTIAALSGIYTNNNTERDRFKEERVTSSQEAGKGKIGYCANENVWTLKMQEPSQPYDPCLDWLAKSSESFDFEVLKTSSSEWCESSS